MPSYIIVVQARMGSNRFPGKTLTQIGSEPMLGLLIASLEQGFEQSKIVIATSENPIDDPIAEFCRERNVQVTRGDEKNVASRYLNIVKTRNLDYFVRINGDSPLIDYRIINSGLHLYNTGGWDIVSTVPNNRFPSGMNAEIVSAFQFLECYDKFSTRAHYEHVTRYFYEKDSPFKIAQIDGGVDNAWDYKFSVDIKSDLIRIQHLVAAMQQPHYKYTLEEKCAIYDKCNSA